MGLYLSEKLCGRLGLRMEIESVENEYTGYDGVSERNGISVC